MTKTIDINLLIPFENHPFKERSRIEQQELTESLKKNGYLHPQFFVDDGISETTFNRPGFQEMESLIEAGKGKVSTS